MYILLKHFILNLSELFSITLHYGLTLYAFFIIEDKYASLMGKQRNKKTKQKTKPQKTNQANNKKTKTTTPKAFSYIHIYVLF